MNIKNNLTFLTIKFDTFFYLLKHILLIILILYPTNLLLTSTFHLVDPIPFYQWLGIHDGMYAFPFSSFLIFYLIYYFINKKLFFVKNFKYLFFFTIYFFLFIIFSNYFMDSIDPRLLKNIFCTCLFFFLIMVFSKFELKDQYLNYKLYNFVLCFICLSNLVNLILYYHSPSFIYFTPDGFNGSYLNSFITHNMDYFPYVVFLSTAIDVHFFKKNLILPSLFIFIKIIWTLIITIYLYDILKEPPNKGLIVSIVFFCISISLIKFVKNIISKTSIFFLIILINMIFLLSIIIFYDLLDASLKDRGESFFYLFDKINLSNILFPLTVKYGFLHNVHNDFFDFYFVYGVFSLFIFYSLSNILMEIFKINYISFLIVFSVLSIGSIVQNNMINIYLMINFAFTLCLIKKNGKTNFL